MSESSSGKACPADFAGHGSCKKGEVTVGHFTFFVSYRKPQAKLVEEKSRSVETVEKEPPFAIIRSG